MAVRTITLYYKGGGSCSHTSDRPEEEWRKLGLEIGVQFTRKIPGILRLQDPYGLHRLSEVSHFHLANYDPPAPDRPMGLI